MFNEMDKIRKMIEELKVMPEREKSFVDGIKDLQQSIQQAKAKNPSLADLWKHAKEQNPSLDELWQQAKEEAEKKDTTFSALNKMQKAIDEVIKERKEQEKNPNSPFDNFR